ncbi:MAG: GNAT family N-acetyltransferase [Candidatus Hermodarchaeota archaeon]
MKIIQIFSKDYPNNKPSLFTYESEFYYDIKIQTISKRKGWKINIQKKRFQTPFKKHVEELVFTNFLREAEYYVALNEDGLEAGWISISKQKWNNTARLWGIDVKKEYRRRGIGKMLLEYGISKAKEWNCRALILECQSSNYPAISFYFKNDFDLTGFDLIAYSNQDLEKHEVRFEMSRILNFNSEEK